MADSPPTYTEATKDGPPAYATLFPVKELKDAKEAAPNKGSFFAKVCEILCGSFACLCCLFILAALPITMIVIGAVYNNCPGQRFIPIWLIVHGSISLFHTLISSLKYCGKLLAKKTDEEGENRNQNRASRGGNACESLLSLFLFIWTIVGSVWVFGYYYSTWAPLNCGNDFEFGRCQCDPVVFMFSYITLIVMYAVSALICCCGCCCVIICGLFFAGAAASGDDD